MKSFMSRLSDQVGGLLRADESERVVSGEFVMLVLTNSHGVRRSQALGAPVQYVVPEDAAIVKFLYLGVPHNSSHPNLSKLFINTLMSEEGQKILYEVYGVDHYRLPGSRAGNELQELQSRGLQPLEIDIKWAIEHPEMTVLTNELVGILRERRGS
jgi:ABC-type Fe3+ transport system substrate-binding protein